MVYESFEEKKACDGRFVQTFCKPTKNEPFNPTKEKSLSLAQLMVESEAKSIFHLMDFS